jgi:hypothetical protein
MNLYWPSSVPYARSKHNRDTKPSAPSPTGEIEGESEANLQLLSRLKNISIQPPQPDAIGSLEVQQLVEPVRSPIYGDLALDEFRLICLSAVTDENFPLRLSLETYSQANCPEYETVSYTWGGEDGDCTLCRPVFIGPYWDVPTWYPKPITAGKCFG